MNVSHLLSFSLLVALCVTGCTVRSSPTQTVTQSAADLPAVGPVVLGGLTTEGGLARRNLDARIDGLEAAVVRQPAVHTLRASLVDSLLTRTAFFGTWTDFDRALVLTRDTATPDQRLLRARVLSALHRFDEALELLAERDDEAAVRQRDTIALAREDGVENVLARRLVAAAEHPNFDNWAGLAAAYATLGRFRDADDAWVRAAHAVRDVSPLPLAFVAFRRGVMWGEVAGYPELAEPLYREAVRRLPDYVVANVHLAEIESAESPEAAIQRVLDVAERTDDAEPFGLAGEIGAATGREDAAAHLSVARSRYDSLLGRHRLAFVDHGSEFFAGPGKTPARAVQLALDNLRNRPTERATLVALEAAIAADDTALACVLTDSAPVEPVTRPLRDVLLHLDATCR